MIFTAQQPQAPSFEFNQPEIQAVAEASYSGRLIPTFDAFQNFVFEHSVIPIEGGNLALRLSKQLTLKMDPTNLRFKVLDWGIEMDYLSLPDLPREIARRFIQLFSNAENDCLTEADQADWLRVLDYVDFKQFSIDRSAPRYMTGTLLRNDGITYVEWHDGSRQKLRHDVAPALTEVNANEQFSAFVKLGKDDEVLTIERVSLVPRPKDAEDWTSWPTEN